jgi:DNA-binding NtrC family response regulator
MGEPFEVLVLDDEPTVCERLKDYLEKKGVAVETFTDGLQAVERFKQKHFDVIVTDLKMQPPDGIDVLVEAKELGAGTQVIIITGYRSIEATRAAEVVGAYGFIDKPFRMEDFFKVVKKAAKRARKRSRRASPPREDS